MRVIASSRASYIAWEMTVSSWLSLYCACYTDVVDRAADDEPERLEAGLHHQELVDRQVAREQARAVLRQPRAASLGDALGALGS